MNRPEVRPLLPQTAPMSNFSFAPPNMGVGDAKKNYVFVDEHNRHKRLKVMRACEGCRRRKIKCDAATTNSWPCAACVRLKLQCVPPTVNYNRAQVGSGQISGLERVLDFADSGDSSGDEGFHVSRPSLHNIYHSDMMTPQSAFSAGLLTSPHQMNFDHVTSAPLSATEQSFQGSFSHHVPSSASIHGPERSHSWPREDMPTGNLSDVLGELKIDENGRAPYIVHQKKTLAEAPALEEFEYSVPASSSGPGATVRIPPELMPNEETCLEWLDIFFADIHPYVPVISKSYFYQQWNTNRGSISPLLLEAIFACAGRLSDDPAQGAQWLALAGKHETCFMDVPRLSTIQALILLLKAREANPKRGYYYRSWMTVKTVFAMAKDLELDEHYAAHQAGRGCSSENTECLVKTRIWQTVFITEMMVGGPQGRNEMSTDPETVDFSIPQTPPGADDEEYQVSRNYSYFVRSLRNVRRINDTYKELKKDKDCKDWTSHPRLAALNPLLPKWLEELPAEMQIHYPPDGTAPWLPSHYVGNIHCYYHLSTLVLHRPQLMASSFSNDGSWKQSMSTCYSAAKSLCRVQEALLQTYGINGLLCMQRGINFAIYCILTCTMLHLAAITSPDPELNTDAKEYFTRHMRILEQCVTAWPMRDLQAQVQSLREAFSADINKPFQLKPSFPYGSPVTRLAASPASESRFHEQTIMHSSSQSQGSHIGFHATPITPPISAGHETPKDGSMPMPMMGPGHRQQPSIAGSQLGDEGLTSWNPTRLFEYGATPPDDDESSLPKNVANRRKSQWNQAFGTPASVSSNPSGIPQNPHSPTAMYSPTASTVGSVPDLHEQLSQHGTQSHYTSVTSNMPPVSPMHPPAPSSYAGTSHPYVSPAMWQDTVASTYVPNDLKRRWDGVSGPAWDHSPQQQQQQQQVKRPIRGNSFG